MHFSYWQRPTVSAVIIKKTLTFGTIKVAQFFEFYQVKRQKAKFRKFCGHRKYKTTIGIGDKLLLHLQNVANSDFIQN